MNILVLNGSPKNKFSASTYFARILGFLLMGCNTHVFSLKKKKSYSEILERMRVCDVVIIAVPLYYDGIPSHILPFLREAEKYSCLNPCKCKVYVLSNGGFIEGVQNKLHLQMYENWCTRAQISWGGGVGIGGGVMLQVLGVISCIISVIFVINVASGMVTHDVLAITSAIGAFVRGIGIITFLNIGLIYAMLMLSWAIRKKKTIENIYIRVMLPSLIFLIITDIFMTLTALFKGKLIFSLYTKGRFKND